MQSDKNKKRKYPIKREGQKGQSRPKIRTTAPKDDELLRLNRYIAHSGVCARREADILIQEGKIKVNGKRVTELGTKVLFSDRVEYNGKKLNFEKPTYILLNKPKGFLSTVKDDRGRRTVMELVASSGTERLFPVGRLDMNTTGLLLLTNDGELTKKLTHPSHEVQKIYHVTVDKAVEDEHIEQIKKGLTLDDGFIKVDSVSRIEKGENNELGLEIHSGKNRIVRRIMEHLGYNVIRLDRVVFANLNKKDIPRGKWRRLSPQEITFLKRITKNKRESPS
jgi:23S rRNA pseudouridine2605 synthase